MQADRTISSPPQEGEAGKSHEVSGPSATKREGNIRFRPAAWLREWVALGNSVEAFVPKGLYLGYDMRRDRSDRIAEMRDLELTLEARKGHRALRSYMVRTGQLRAGCQL